MDHDALPEHLIRVPLEDFEAVRRKRGKGFAYQFRDGSPVRDEEQLALLKSIRVPATWTEVKLSLHPRAYIRATGFDGSGKLQYLYHHDYLAFRNELKFSELQAFGLALPRIRRALRRDLARGDWDQRKLLALMVRILDKYHLRVGSRVYARRHQTYGLSTLRKKHLKEGEHEVILDYVGKGGQRRQVALHDPQLVELIHEVAEFPGHELFSIRQGGEHIRADSAAVNAYIKEIARADFTARSFRTWAGTVLSIKHLPRARREVAANPRRELPAVLAELVAESLGNTPAICRAYYIHPQVFEAVIAEDFDPAPCEHKFLRNSLYRRHECRALEILSAAEAAGDERVEASSAPQLAGKRASHG